MISSGELSVRSLKLAVIHTGACSGSSCGKFNKNLKIKFIPEHPVCLKCRDFFAVFSHLCLHLCSNKQLHELSQKMWTFDDYMRVGNSRDLVERCFW